MSRRLLGWAAAISAFAMLLGFFVVDRPLAEWIRSSGIEDARVFAWGLAALDTVSGMGLWIWLAGLVALVTGAIGIVSRPGSHWPRAFVAAAAVQLATIATMIVGKDHFGRLRPYQVLASGDWSHAWFAGGVSFPSGHSAFYFGLLLPLAASCRLRWLRVLLLAVPVYVVLARLELAKHFLSDVSTCALIAALYGLLVATLAKRWLPPSAADA